MISWKSAALAVLAIGLAAACEQKTLTSDTPAADAPVAAAAPRGPALWKMSDADTTIYMFGAVHVLPPELVWRTPALDKALGEARAIYFETDVNPDISKMVALIEQIGRYPVSDRLSDHLQPDDRTALAAAASKLNIPMVNLEPLKPWLAAVTLSEQMIANAGYDVNSGVERKLLPDAEAAGKDIRKLETVEQQLTVFADLPEKVQIRFLMEGVRQMEEEAHILSDMVDAWARGDIDTLDRIMIQEDLAENPDVYRALLVNRNEAWVKKLDALLKDETGTFFVAVGAAHLIGKDSVIAKLGPLGHSVGRVE
jgi:uncharacterized protein